MKITVRVFGDLKSVLGKRLTCQIEGEATVRSLANQISRKAGLKPSSFIGRYRREGGDLAILLNGRNIRLLEGMDTSLKDGDEVVFLPPAPGG